MKSKTIKKRLENKIQEWIDNVDDKKIKNIIQNHSIVTGGSIASMFHNQDVSDYDIYLDSKPAVLAICAYYINLLNDPKGKKVTQVTKCPMYNIEILDGANDPDYDYYSETFYEREYSNQKGMAIHKLGKDRVKLFMQDAGMFRINDDDKNDKKGNPKKYFPVFISPNAITLSDDIQIIIRFYGDPEEIHKNYDFVHATNWYSFKDKVLHLRHEALESLLTKELRYIGSKYPVTSIIRTKKFILRGYTINAAQYMKMCYQVSQLNLADPVVLEDQLTGVDVAYFEIILDAMREKKKSLKDWEATYSWLATMLDRIFDGNEITES